MTRAGAKIAPPAPDLRRLLSIAAAAALVGTLPLAPQAGAQAPAGTESWPALAERYAADPIGTRNEVLARARGGVEGQGMPVLFVVADAHLRRGQVSSARRYFEQIVEEAPEKPPGSLLVSYAHVGLGMIAVRTGDLPAARASFATASEVASGGLDQARWLANVAEAQTAAAMGDTDEAIMMLEDLVETAPLERAPPGVVDAARFALGTAHMEAGEYTAAAAIFDALASAGGEGVEDARYAAARARLGSGETEAARNALARLVADCPSDVGPKERAASRVRDLEPYGVLRAWIENYRELPFDALRQRGGVYALGGCDLARTTLARIERDGGWRAPPREPLPIAAEEDAVPEERSDEATDDASAAPSPPPANETGAWSPWTVAGIVAAVGALALLALGRLRRR